jgi:hypothetical protein
MRKVVIANSQPNPTDKDKKAGSDQQDRLQWKSLRKGLEICWKESGNSAYNS